MDDECVKGLKNNGKNICFLNVICQSLWNLYHVKTFLFNNMMHEHCKTNIIESSEKISSTINKLSQEYESKIDDYTTPFDKKGLDPFSYKENCLQCVLLKFFSNYLTSNLNSIDTEEIREILVNLNNSIQKFSKSGVILK